MLFSVLLENRDLLKQIVKDQAFVIDPTLREAARLRAQLVVFSPNIAFYRGQLPSAVMVSSYLLSLPSACSHDSQSILRDQQITGLPPTKETGQCKMVSQLIGRDLTNARFALKLAVSRVSF
jgi:hypothetical protein